MTPERQATMAGTQKEYEREQAVLGISGKLRQITDSYSPVDAPNAPNYDEGASTPYPYTANVLGNAKTADQGRKVRRPQLVERCDREIFGRAPKVTPEVAWSVAQTANEDVGGHAAVTR